MRIVLSFSGFGRTIIVEAGAVTWERLGCGTQQTVPRWLPLVRMGDKEQEQASEYRVVMASRLAGVRIELDIMSAKQLAYLG